MNLHLGCGQKLWPGWVNIDRDCGDVEMDIRKLDYADCAADEIAAIHVIEHFYPHEVTAVLREWHRVLQPGGRLTLELPSMNKVSAYLQREGKADARMVMFALYGDPKTHRSEADLHKWCWLEKDIVATLKVVGFKTIWSEMPEFHVPERDMRLVAIK